MRTARAHAEVETLRRRGAAPSGCPLPSSSAYVVDRFHPKSDAGLLVPEGGQRPARHAARRRAGRAGLRARHARALPRDLRALARRSRSATASRSRCTRARRSAARRPSTVTRSGSATRTSAARSARSSRSARALADVDCWITGIRRDQSPTRADAPKLGWDERHELWKANPLADWSDDDVWSLRPRARAAGQRAARPRLRVDRLHALHAARRRS